MAVRCWCLKFQPADHQFLHECHVFSNISRILSKSEEEREENGSEPPQVRTAFKAVPVKIMCPPPSTYRKEIIKAITTQKSSVL